MKNKNIISWLILISAFLIWMYVISEIENYLGFFLFLVVGVIAWWLIRRINK